MDKRSNARYWAKVEVRQADQCWPWTACTNPAGYGMFSSAQEQLAHRYGFRLEHGDIPEGLHVCHRCDNPPCQNPAHLFLGTHKDNHDDKIAKGRHRWGEPQPGDLNPRAKLTAADVALLRELRTQGRTQDSLAIEFGISQAQVGRIVRNERWVK